MSFSLRALVFVTVLTRMVGDVGSAEPQSGTLELEPSKTQIEFRLAGALHTTHGTFTLERGLLSGDLATGQAGGLTVVDARSGDSGIGARDDRMKNAVLEVQKYPEVTFVPTHIVGQLGMDNQFRASLEGILTLHGTDHSIAMEVQGRLIGDSLVAKSHFSVPYVEWGMEDPSVLFLTVAKAVDIDVATEGHVAWSGDPSRSLTK